MKVHRIQNLSSEANVDIAANLSAEELAMTKMVLEISMKYALAPQARAPYQMEFLCSPLLSARKRKAFSIHIATQTKPT